MSRIKQVPVVNVHAIEHLADAAINIQTRHGIVGRLAVQAATLAQVLAETKAAALTMGIDTSRIDHQFAEAEKWAAKLKDEFTALRQELYAGYAKFEAAFDVTAMALLNIMQEWEALA